MQNATSTASPLDKMPPPYTWVDTHAHIYDEAYQGKQAHLLTHAQQSGVQAICMPNLDATTLAPMCALAKQHPTLCYPMLGLHPCHVTQDPHPILDTLEEQLAKPSFIGIGEIGLDFYHDTTYQSQQEAAFIRQLQWAQQYHLPVSIHCRNAFEALFRCLEKMEKPIKGVLHCFTGNLAQAQQAIAFGLHLGIGGIVTFKKSSLPTVLKTIPLQHLVLETDSPYLAPTPFRGQRNTPTYLPYIAAVLADIYEINMTRIAQSTTAQAQKLFGFSHFSKK